MSIGNCFAIFFVSGAAALILEISWARQIGLLFGHTTHAAAIVLAAFFVGLATGNSLGGRMAHRVNPLKMYAVAELTVAVWSCVVPVILAAAHTELGAGLLRNDSVALQIALRAVFCLMVLLPATVAMGSTLPLMAEFLLRSRPTGITLVSRAYAFNTAGAFTGVVVATLFLLVVVGVRSSGFVAAGLSATCGIVALMVELRDGRQRLTNDPIGPKVEAASEAPGTTELAATVSKRWTVLAGVCGFGTLALQVVYLRLFSLVFHNSTYTFGIVVAVYLLALAFGAWLASVFLRRVSSESLLTFGCWAGGLLTALSVMAFVHITELQYFQTGDTFASYLTAATLLVAVIVFPPVTLLGLILPTLWNAATGETPHRVKTIGTMTMVNTLSAAVGSLAASFFMLPWLGLWGSFVAVTVIFCAVSCWLFSRQNRHRSFILVVLSIIVVAIPLIIPPGAERWAAPTDEQLVRRWHSAYGWIDVVRDTADDSLKVRQNRHYRFGSTGPEATRMYRQAHLPLLLHSQPRDVAFLGLGTGLTAAGAVPHEQLDSISIVELIPEVVDAARLLCNANFGIVDHPKVQIDIDDARHFLQGTDQQFDVIVSDLFVPWESETGYLYTVEHYQQARSRLRPGGVFCQWLPLYQLGQAEFKMIADSFASVFPKSTLWWGNVSSQRAIVALIGSEHELQLHASAIDQRIARLNVTGMFQDDSLQSAQRLYECLNGAWPVRLNAVLNTDEHPRVEFLTPASQGNHRLLKGDLLIRYFDDVLLKLPDDGVHFHETEHRKPPASQQQRREWLRFILLSATQRFQHHHSLPYYRMEDAVVLSLSC
ncbi:MAG: fused MFS/spermidine synthase [Fuerstiella sp.]